MGVDTWSTDGPKKFFRWSLKRRLRAWLIDLVREAVRIERAAEQKPPAAWKSHRFNGAADSIGELFIDPKPGRVYKESIPLPADPIQLEPSFEQMQADALKGQTEFYEVKK